MTTYPGKFKTQSRSFQPQKFRFRFFTPFSLAVILGLGSGCWFLQSAIAPPSVHAYTARVDVAIDHRAGESYETLLRRAEVAARAATQRSFDRDILTSSVSVIVTAQNNGLAVPVLAIEVSRNQWRNRPDPQHWATYFRTAKVLLKFEEAVGISPNRPATVTTPTTTPTTTTQPQTPATPAGSETTPTEGDPATTTPGTTAPGTPPDGAPIPRNQPGTTPGTTPDAGTQPTTPGTTPGATPTPGTQPATPGTTPGATTPGTQPTTPTTTPGS